MLRDTDDVTTELLTLHVSSTRVRAQLMSVCISGESAQNFIYDLCITLCNVVKFESLFPIITISWH